MKRFVLTGGPGTGKTTTIAELKRRGYSVLRESARDIIAEELAKKTSDALPWKNVFKFQELLAELQIKTELASLKENKTDIVFLDRGILDGLAYCALAKQEPPTNITEHHKLYPYDKVFVLEPLPHRTDEERREDSETATAIHHEIIRIYRAFGYELIFIPVMPVTDRVDRILTFL